MKAVSSRRGGILFGLSLFGLFVICLAAASVWLISRNVHIYSDHREHDRVSIETPAGSLDIRRQNAYDASHTGAPVYPGAKPTRDGGAMIEWSSPKGDNKGLTVAEYFTPDPFDQVVDYYRGQLNDWNIEHANRGSVMFQRDEKGNKRFVGIESKSDGTHIGLASVGEPAAN
jgi:hypothetical protein